MMDKVQKPSNSKDFYTFFSILRVAMITLDTRQVFSAAFLSFYNTIFYFDPHAISQPYLRCGPFLHISKCVSGSLYLQAYVTR
jgi:hypothetical protein